MLTLRANRVVTIAALLAVGLLALPAPAADEGWSVDFAAAKKAAAAEGKDVFMEFTGSDWCPPCKALHAQILSQDIFMKEAPSSFVLLKLDNPHDKSRQTPQEIEQYQRLSKEYEIRGVPTIILADPSGKPYAKMVGFGGGTPADYIENLKKLQQVRVKRDENLAKAANASGIEKAKHLDAAIGGIDPELASTLYKSEVEQIIALDADNAAGLKGKYEGVLKAKEFKSRLEQASRKPGGQAEAIDALIAELKPTGALLQEALFYKGYFVGQSDKAAGAKVLQQAIDVDPNSSQAAQIKAHLERLKQ